VVQKGQNRDPSGGFIDKSEHRNFASWGYLFEARPGAKIMKYHAYKFASFSLLKLIIPCLLDAIWGVRWRNFIKKPLDQCKMWPWRATLRLLISIEFQQQSKKLKASKLQMSNLDVQPRWCGQNQKSQRKNKKTKKNKSSDQLV